jgi:hypothetical protein
MELGPIRKTDERVVRSLMIEAFARRRFGKQKSRCCA